MQIISDKSNIRLDTYLSEETEYTRSKIQKLIKDNQITVNDKKTNSSYKLKENDIININELEEEITDILPEKMDLDIVYEDEYLAIINKQSGLVVHPAVGNLNHTLVNGLLFKLFYYFYKLFWWFLFIV